MLDKSPQGDQDSVVFLYTKHFGRLSAFVKSGRKSTSKLSPHLEPGSVVRLRLIQPDVSAGRFQVADALSESRHSSAEAVRFLHFLKAVTPELDSDYRLWETLKLLLKEQRFDGAAYGLLWRFLGFGDGEVRCARCRNASVDYFSHKDIVFLCRRCSRILNLSEENIIAIGTVL